MPARVPTVIALVLLGHAGCDAGGEKDVAAEPTPAAAAPTPGSDPGAPTEAPSREGREGPNEIDSNREAMPEPTAPKPLDAAPSAASELLTLEARSPAVRDGKVALNVGIVAPGGRVAPILRIGCALPCWQPIPMWPKGPEDTTVEFSLVRSASTSAEGAHAIGTFVVDPVPTPPPGTRAEVVVGLGVVDGAVVAHARLRSTGAALPLKRKP